MITVGILIFIHCENMVNKHTVYDLTSKKYTRFLFCFVLFVFSYIMKKKCIYLENLVPRMPGCLHVKDSGPGALKWLYQNGEKKIEGHRLGTGNKFRRSSRKREVLVLWFIQFTSVTQSCPTLCNPMDCNMPGLPVHHQLLEFTQSHLHWVGDPIQPSCHLSSPSPPAFNHSQHQGLLQWVSSSH